MEVSKLYKDRGKKETESEKKNTWTKKNIRTNCHFYN